MSETAGTIIKLLAALTSPKACVKYLTVAIALYLSWLYVAPNLNDLKINSEQKSLLLLLVGLGGGALIGHFLSETISLIWDRFKISRDKKNEENKKEQDAMESKKLKLEKEEALLEQIKSMFQYFTSDQKKLLRELTDKDQTVDTRSSEIVALLNNEFIHNVIQVQHKAYVVAINPVLKEFIKQHWQAELEMRINEFFEAHGENAQRLLNVMQHGESISKIDPSILEGLTSQTGIIRVGLDDEDVPGQWLWFDLHIREKLTEMNAIEYADELFIEEAMFTKSA
jgi:hypothetical protein